MYDNPINSPGAPEEFLAELTDAAYRVALRHGIKGSFVEVELDLWTALRDALARERSRRVRVCGSSD